MKVEVSKEYFVERPLPCAPYMSVKREKGKIKFHFLNNNSRVTFDEKALPQLVEALNAIHFEM